MAQPLLQATRADPPPAPGARPVLVIEDDRLIRELIVEHLADDGFPAPAAAANLPAARAWLADHHPALILLDLMLPGETGWQFLRQRLIDPRLAAVPVLVISAAPAERLLEAERLGADACISKPFDLDALSEVVRGFVQQAPETTSATIAGPHAYLLGAVHRSR